MIDFWFRDAETGEDFFVEVDDDCIATALYKAWEIAKQYFNTPHYVTSLSPAEAERYGFDTY